MSMSALDMEGPDASAAPTAILLKPGEHHSISIDSANRWNDTRIQLVKGAQYRFEARGTWRDGKAISCGPGGTADGKFQSREVVHVLMTGVGKLEGLLKRIPGAGGIDLWLTRRYEQFPWYSLVGAVTDGSLPQNDRSPVVRDVFLIGEGCPYPRGEEVLQEDGRLFCFANDAWHAYWNNEGCIDLEVTRVK